MTFFPADIASPVLGLGSIKLASAYAGKSFEANNTLTTQDISFINDGSLDTSALDTFQGNNDNVKITKIYDQIGSINAIQADTTKAFAIFDQPIGTARAMVTAGESASGALYGMVMSSLSGLGITAKDYCVIAVVQPSSSAFVNQAGAPGVSTGCLLDLQGSGGTVLRIYNNAQDGTLPGGWQVTDGSFDFTALDSNVPTNAFVLTVVSNSSGVKVYVNETIRATASRSALIRTATTAYLGWLSSSSAGADSHCFGGSLGALLLYATAPTEREMALIRSSLYSRFGIEQRITKYSTRQVVLVGDSIAAGYTPPYGIYGYYDYLESLLDYPVQLLNYALPGNTITRNPPNVVPYAYVIGQIPTMVAPNLATTKATGSRVCIIHGGGNDIGIGPGSQTGTTHSNTIIDNLSSTAGMAPGQYVMCPVLPTLSTIVSVDSGTRITISSSTTASSPGVVITVTTQTPAIVAAGIQTASDMLRAAGATAVIVVPILPRSGGNNAYQPWIDAINALLPAGTNYTYAANCLTHGSLGTNPGPDYADGTHLTQPEGGQDMANALAPYVNALL